MSGSLQSYRVNNKVNSEIAISYAQAESLVSFVFPTVGMNQRGGKFMRFGKSQFVTASTKRTPYANHKRTRVEGWETVDFFLEQHTKMVEVAIEEIEEAENGDAQIDLRAHALQQAMAEMEQSIEAEVYNLITTPANYEASNVVAVSAANKLTAAGSDPEALIRNNKLVVSGQIGLFPTRAIVGEDVYNALTLHPLFRERLKHTIPTAVTLDLVAAWLGLPGGIRVAQRRTLADDGSLEQMWPAETMLMWYDVRDGYGFLGSNDDGELNMFTPVPGISKSMPNFGYCFTLKEGLRVSDFEFERRNDCETAIIRADLSCVLTSVGDTNASNAGILLNNLLT